MFAIIETGGKQYKVSKDSIIAVEKLEVKEGDKITLDKILFIQNDDSSSLIGKPLLDKCKIEAKVIKVYKDEKIIIFKKRKRQNSRRKNGHRQQKIDLQILSIKVA